MTETRTARRTRLWADEGQEPDRERRVYTEPWPQPRQQVRKDRPARRRANRPATLRSNQSSAERRRGIEPGSPPSSTRKSRPTQTAVRPEARRVSPPAATKGGAKAATKGGAKAATKGGAKAVTEGGAKSAGRPGTADERAAKAKAQKAAGPSPVQSSSELPSDRFKAHGPGAVRAIRAAGRVTGRVVAVRGSAALAHAHDPATDPAHDSPTGRHLRLVRKERTPRLSPRQRTRLVLSVTATVLLAAAFGLVYLHVVLAQRQFKLDQLNRQLAQAQTTYQSEQLQVSQLSSPARIISTAEGKLGMVQPSSVTYLYPKTSIAGSTPASTPAATSGSEAPAGPTDWTHIKSDLGVTP